MTEYNVSDVITVAVLALFAIALGVVVLRYTYLSVDVSQRSGFYITATQLLILSAKAISVYVLSGIVVPPTGQLLAFFILFLTFAAR